MSSRVRWLLLVGCALGAVSVLAGLSLVVWWQARERWQSERRAALEENVRLSLWRIDGLVAAELARENLEELPRGVAALPDEPHVAGRLLLDGARVVGSAGDRERLQTLAERAPAVPSLPVQLAQVVDKDVLGTYTQPQNNEPTGSAKYEAIQQRKGSSDLYARSRAVFNTSTNATPSSSLGDFDEYEPVARPSPPRKKAIPRSYAPPASAFTASWIDGELLLSRAVLVDGRSLRLVVWMKWESLANALLGEAAELLPSARLERVIGIPPRPTRTLASLPVELVPGPLPARDEPPTPVVWPLLSLAWMAALVISGALLVLVIGIARLSERRAAFVSAVTHELRTPLTTFRMYTEMLAAGMVPDEARRKTYLDTLQREASRLSHLVENVLSFSRVEQGRRPPKPEPTELGPFLERLLPRLEERASQATMHVVAPEHVEATVLADAGGLEQILFNLVDNASKYAASATDRNIELTVENSGHAVRIGVRDHGPGIDAEARRELFTPFSKSAHRAANTAPGVGLGLALCRRLARSMGGDLRYEPHRDGGARFVVVLTQA